MLHRHRDTYPRLQWTTQTLLGLLPPLILLLLLRIVILVFSSISTATSSPSSPMPMLLHPHSTSALLHETWESS
ncbi:hypothetical protein C8R45DRAFT_1007031 [Mycena sanguinolenta]|nr:hypothetical protein C8R45DRAFT_1007031 [Mycena sanguinolenta]